MSQTAHLTATKFKATCLVVRLCENTLRGRFICIYLRFACFVSLGAPYLPIKRITTRIFPNLLATMGEFATLNFYSQWRNLSTNINLKLPMPYRIIILADFIVLSLAYFHYNHI